MPYRMIGSWQPYGANTIILIISSLPSEELHAMGPIASSRERTPGRNRCQILRGNPLWLNPHSR